MWEGLVPPDGWWGAVAVTSRAEEQDLCRPYIERDVAAELAARKIAWKKRSISEVVRELLRRSKQSK